MISTTYCLIMSETLAETWETCRWREWSRKNLSLLMSQNWVLTQSLLTGRPLCRLLFPERSVCNMLPSWVTRCNYCDKCNEQQHFQFVILPSLGKHSSLSQFSATTLCSWHTLCKAVPDQSSLRPFHFHLKKAWINILQTNAFWDPGSLCSHTCLITGLFPYLSEFFGSHHFN